MSAKIEKTVNDLTDAIKLLGKSKTSPYDSTATVVRVENGIAWVHFDGGEAETPAKLTMNAKPGEQVQVRVSGGTAFLVGNATNPPTDDTRANAAYASSEVANIIAKAAQKAAAVAQESAVQAVSSAETAKTAADNAQESAGTANKAANNALGQLSIVENVVGTLNWISEHATYKASADTEVQPGKYYFTRSGSGTSSDPYVYSVVINPTGDPSTNGWYEIDRIDEAVSNYIASHLALDNSGLWVTLDNNGYKLLLSSDGVSVYDPESSTPVSTFGESITFASSRPQKIGGTNAYVEWYDSDDDGVADSLRIVGANISITSGDSIDTAISNAVQSKAQAEYGVCTPGYSATVFDVVSNDFSLYTGAKIAVRFTAHTFAPRAIALNVNNTGEKSVILGGEPTGPSNIFWCMADAVISFIYDGSSWVVDDKPSTYYATCSTAATLNGKHLSIPVTAGWFLQKGAQIAVTFTNQQSSTAQISLDIPASSDGSLSLDRAVNVYVNGEAFANKPEYNWPANSLVTFVISGQNTAEMVDTASLTQSGVFKRLTNNGTAQGIFMENGQLYLNMSYAKTGTLEAGRIQSYDNSSYWDLDTGELFLNDVKVNYQNNLLIGTSFIGFSKSAVDHQYNSGISYNDLDGIWWVYDYLMMDDRYDEFLTEDSETGSAIVNLRAGSKDAYYYWPRQIEQVIYLEKGVTYTFSCSVRDPNYDTIIGQVPDYSSGIKFEVTCGEGNSEGEYAGDVVYTSNLAVESSDYENKVVSFTVPVSCSYLIGLSVFPLGVVVGGMDTEVRAFVKNFKIEAGSKATDWSSSELEGYASKVSKLGDEMIGDLYFNSFLKTITNPYGSPKLVGHVGRAYTTGSTGRIWSEGVRIQGGEDQTINYLELLSNGVNVSNPEYWRSAINAVNKSGDTMTGDLVFSKGNPYAEFKNTEVDAKQSDNGITATRYSGVRVYDNNDLFTGVMYSSPTTNGDMRTGIWAYNYDTNGNRVGNNYIIAGVKKNGTLFYDLADEDAFRTKLGLGNAVVTGTIPSSVSVPSATYTSVGIIPLTPGVWLLVGQVSYPANANGVRYTSIGQNVSGQIMSVYHGASPAGVTRQNVCTIATVTSNATYNLIAYQSSGSTLAMQTNNCRFFGFKLA